MQHAAALLGKCEAVSAAGRLVIDSINRKSGIVTEQKSTDRPVADEEDVARSVSSQDVFNLLNNAQLGILCSLPTTNADEGLREKLVSHCLKLVRHQKACRRSIVLVHRLPYLYIDLQFCGNNLGRLNRLSLSAGDELCRTRKSSRVC